MKLIASWLDAEEAIEFQCQPMICNNNENNILLKEFKILNIANVPVHLTDLTIEHYRI